MGGSGASASTKAFEFPRVIFFQNAPCYLLAGLFCLGHLATPLVVAIPGGKENTFYNASKISLSDYGFFT